MARRFQLQTLLDHARHRMQAAERLLLMLKRKEEAARLKHEELERYGREYRERLTGTTQSGMSIDAFRDYHVFLGKLDQAVRQQAGEVVALHQRWEAAQGEWLELRRKVQSYEVLEHRHIQAEQRRQDIREQKQSDELTNRRVAAERIEERNL